MRAGMPRSSWNVLPEEPPNGLPDSASLEGKPAWPDKDQAPSVPRVFVSVWQSFWTPLCPHLPSCRVQNQPLRGLRGQQLFLPPGPGPAHKDASGVLSWRWAPDSTALNLSCTPKPHQVLPPTKGPPCSVGRWAGGGGEGRWGS